VQVIPTPSPSYQQWTQWGTWYSNLGPIMGVKRLTAGGGLSQLDFLKPNVIHCPSYDGTTATVNFKVNHFAPSLQNGNKRSRDVKKASSRTFVVDSLQDEPPINDTLYFSLSATYQNKFQMRHKGAANLLYLDGHVVRVPEVQFRATAGVQFQWSN
jgi:prepilin-type processing-associated H-X9-DG protein